MPHPALEARPIGLGDVVVYDALREYSDGTKRIDRLTAVVRSITEQGTLIFPLSKASITAKRNDPAVLCQELTLDPEAPDGWEEKEAWLLTWMSGLKLRSDVAGVQ